VRAVSVIGLVMLVASTALAQDSQSPASPWDRGRFGISLAAGSQQVGDESYVVIGVGARYFVVEGLSVGLFGAQWFGGQPSVTEVRPTLTYVFTRVPIAVKPYVGGFYNHWFVGDGFDDVDSVGGTVGLSWFQNPLVLSLGVAVERLISECADECTEIYPQFGLALAF
jgi:hypothetical protein